MTIFKPHPKYNKWGRQAYVVIGTLTTILSFSRGYTILSALTYMWFQIASMYAYGKTSRCPLEIALRVRPTQYHKAFRRMYKDLYVRMVLIYFGFIICLTILTVLKIHLWVTN